MDEAYMSLFKEGEGAGEGIKQTNYDLSWEGCKITMTYNQKNIGAPQTARKIEFQLSDLDQSSFEHTIAASGEAFIDSGHMGLLKIYTTKKEDKINCGNGVLENYIEIPVSKPEMGGRMIKAWKHAIKLCGGKETKELF
jgi:hypothetical protein